MNNGIHTELTDDEYFDTDRVSASGCKKLIKSPKKFKAANIYEKNDDAKFRLGDLCHCAVYEPFNVEKKFFVLPKWGGAGSKKRKEEALATNAGKTAVNQSEWDMCMRIRDAVFESEAAGPVLSALTHNEVAVFWEDVNTGIACKAKMDGVAAGAGVITDLKTTLDASPDGFARTVEKFHYDLQASFYLSGWNNVAGSEYRCDTFLFIAVEKEHPYDVCVYDMPPEWIAIGREKYLEALERYKDCVKRDYWPGYSDKVITLRPPQRLLEKYGVVNFEAQAA